ncbi:response regulator [Bradyrhizobium ontarionense]|uniref:Response regulator n=1 Tax=Bradyrhizobium ontarionense TaxID=2898149 RepID=A0ABY3RGD3_9BRAD|nr:response regulator [Bradyrhizobium sp. A19]UFZ06057.1 response regulator [Bradyrhizobium sp. A19]
MPQRHSPNLLPKLLIADDDPCVVRVLAERCSLMGFEVETANGGLQALIKACEIRPDIMVIDVHMPEVDGLSVLTLLTESTQRSEHVIVITGQVGQEITEFCSHINATCIRKGSAFWSDFEKRLIEFYPEKAADIRWARSERTPQRLTERARVLLIDDDMHVRRFYASKLANLGVDLLCAADGASGYWMARRQEPTVIIADYAMPNGDAEYLLTKLRSTPETSTIPVIVQSARSLSNTVRRRLEGSISGYPGAARVLRKSADVGELFDVLQRLCGFSYNLEGSPLYQ